jgi:peptidyl-prolyl cis-trans isomerase D
MLQQMRSLAKYVWLLVALAFVGGFLLYETSGLMGRTPVTNTTAVAVVNGHEIMYRDYTARVQNQLQSDQQREGRTLSQDDQRRIENSVFDAMVTDVLLSDEYRRRGIVVSDDEIREFARYAPPPNITSDPSLQTDGQFDPQKYARLLASPQARQTGLLAYLENYYRTEIPREKLFDQIASGVYVTDPELWRAWRDQHDSASVSYVAFTPVTDTAAMKSISDADLKTYFDQHSADFQGPGRAVMSLVTIQRSITAADTAAAKAKADALRAEIVKGAKFEDVAKRESSDTASAANGGDLGKGVKGRFVPEFEKAAYALPVGEVSQPVLTPYGFHLIKVDSKKGDTLSLRHILVPIQPSDTATSRVDKEADSLAKMAAQAEGTKLDSAAHHLNLPIYHLTASENQPAMLGGRIVPSASAWAFGGAKPGDISEMFDDENGYYVARLDTLREGGDPKFENVKDQVRARVAALRAVDKLLPEAQRFASVAASTSLDAAAAAANKKVAQTQMFARGSLVPGLGQFSEAVGAAFGLPTSAVSQPVKTDDGVYVLRVDKRILADSAAWVAQKQAQKSSRLQQLRQQKIQMYLQDLRKAAKVDDRRKSIQAAVRQQQA